ncbi:hypothetical protein [Psychromicrobium lacuslunae]|nr:hypothetical protein [Psychromicrobium lacuslunae]
MKHRAAGRLAKRRLEQWLRSINWDAKFIGGPDDKPLSKTGVLMVAPEGTPISDKAAWTEISGYLSVDGVAL